MEYNKKMKMKMAVPPPIIRNT